jgi:hypothetical protein
MRAWKAFKNVSRYSVGSEKAENYSEIVLGRIPACSAMECDWSLEPYLLHSRSEFFSHNTWELSPMNMAKGSIRMFPKLKGSAVENGVRIFRLTAAGVKGDTNWRK